MEKMINGSTLQRIARSLASFGALFTMVMAPVAQGAEVENFTKSQMQNVLDQMGLNKQITIGEFYQKNKNLFPTRIQKEIEPVMMQNKNQLMPQVEVVMSKASDGRDIPNVRLTNGNDLVNVQWFGEKDRFVKIQNTNLTEIDIVNFTDMFDRLSAGDEKIRKEFNSATPSANGKFMGFPAVTNVTWKAMTQKERAGYIVQMRLLWNDSRRVLIEMDKRATKKGQKTSSNETIEKIDHLFAMFEQPTEAAAPTKTKEVTKVPAASLKGGNPEIKSNGGSSAFVSGDNCIVAGYVSKYTGTKCSVDNIYDSYTGEKNSLVQKTREECQATGQIACNPFIYGTPGGKAACIPLDDSFQKATHANGPCESLSKLGDSTDFLKNDTLKNESRYLEANRSKSDKELDDLYFNEQESKFRSPVEDLLNGLLSYGGKAGVMFTQPLSADILANILAIKKTFDEEIKIAKLSCEKAASNKNNEKNFWGACDQLHRRFLNVARFLEKHPGCKDGGRINESDLLCACPAPQPGAIPGTSCGVTPPACPEPVKTPVVIAPPQISTPPAANPTPVQACIPVPKPPVGETPKPDKPKKDEKCTNENYANIVGIDGDCKCPGGGNPQLTSGNGDDADSIKVYECRAKLEITTPKDCGILCSIGKFVKKYALNIALGVGVTYLAYKLLKPKKPAINPAGDLCPNGSTVALCAQPCPGVQVRNSAGGCGCAVCPPGQVTSDSTACTCSTTPTPTTPTITCADGVTKVTDSTLCPKASYKCWDGSVVPTPLNCPEKPTTTIAPPAKSKK